jgi:hypothetical protein
MYFKSPSSVRSTEFRTVSSVAFIALMVLFPTTSSAATLNFDELVGPATGSTLIGNSSVAQTTTARFTNVATENGRVVDAMIVATVKDSTDFAETGSAGYFGDGGFIPDYRPAGTNASADLGFLYYGNGINSIENGISLAFSFFDGSGDLSGTFGQSILVDTLNFAIYDVDGESVAKGGGADQSEFFRAFASDGLESYQLGTTEQALTATQEGDELTFRGPDKNYAESDASGAVVLNYANTSSFTLDFGSVQSSGANQNGVFSAFDGDLSLIDLANFGPEVAPVSQVPAPASLPLLVTALGAGWIAQRRKKRPSC